MAFGLPIGGALPALRQALTHDSSAVLQAPPGAGKSTVVPLALLDEPWLRDKRILMLEPRRLAARAVAQRMSHTLGEGVGRTIGYRMRMDTRVSRDTRIEVVTEGVLTRMLQNDPALEGVGLVIFDEFHERSLQADLGLALVLDARENLTPGLKVLVMSATLDGEAVARLLGNAPIVTSEGRMFPVESRFAGKGAPPLPAAAFGPTAVPADSPEKVTAQLIARALREELGDVLVFLPGAREIRRVQSLIEASPGVRVLPLYGELSAEEQDAALTPSTPGTRKVVLATNIAETSLTIQGVRVVIDSGLVRRSMFDPSTGMSRLETQRISRASADQRQGRAGRTEPGVCYRAWSEGAHRSLAPFTPPEIVEADLVPLALELASWGTRDPNSLRWLDPPPAAMLASARDVLEMLGALDPHGRITAHGREMASIGVHPRFAHMLLRARAIGRLPLAADLAALLSERDLLRGVGTRDADIRTRIEIMRGEGSPAGVDRFGLQRARRAAKDLLGRVDICDASNNARSGSRQRPRSLPAGDAVMSAKAPQATFANVLRQVARDGGAAGGAEDAGIVLAFAYPDRIGRRRAGSDGRFTLANGRGAYFAEPTGLAKQDLIVAVDLDDRERDARILLAAPLARADLEEQFVERLRRRESVEWSSREQAVIARRTVELGAIVLEEKPLPEIPVEAARKALLTGVRELGIGALPWTRDARDLQARIEFVRKLEQAGSESWPAVSDAELTARLESWLEPWLDGITRKEHLARISLIDVLRSLLTWEQQRELDTLAPTHLEVPTGSRIRIDYLDPSAPAIAVRLQEVFGLDATPRIGGGRIPVTFKLLSPAQRPVQVTRDLASFWRGSYAEVRKDMRGRYPKHHWPENPLEAQPTRGVRRKR
ncbi:MAG TPA: ATP-dependent helicase HrpB [Steroidobacteraceae bacterium]|nr:ATP-dependent helicase HrpB [Steroidobacteraceae bacterium]